VKTTGGPKKMRMYTQQIKENYFKKKNH